MSVIVYPVLDPDRQPTRSLTGIPPIPLSTTKTIADRLVRTGAFTTTKSAGMSEPIELDEAAYSSGIERLDFYDPPLKHGEHYLHPERVNLARLEPEARKIVERRLAEASKPEGPPTGGPSDSEA